MPSAEIITIGTEILLGELVDTNTAYIARCLRNMGIDLFRKASIGDNAQRIAAAINSALERANIIITTGGLGPTIDDPTREAVALAFKVETEFQPELWQQIQDRFARFGRTPSENNRRQAYIPEGAIAVENPVGTAPAFIVETGDRCVISLPGVPREMEYLMEHAVQPYLKKRYPDSGLIKARVLHTAGAGESQIDELIGDLETLSNPTVGLAAHSGQVDVRITAKAASEAQADAMIEEVEAIVRQRLGEWIFGSDEEALDQVVTLKLKERGHRIVLLDSGLRGDLLESMAAHPDVYLAGMSIPQPLDEAEMHRRLLALKAEFQAEVALGTAMHPGEKTQIIKIVLLSPGGEQAFERLYGGPPKLAARYAVNQSLNLLRNL